MNYKDVINKASKELHLEEEFLIKVYRAYWKIIKEYIESRPLKDDLTKEELEALRPNINIPSIGKFSVTFERYERMKKKFNIIKKIKDESNKTN